MKKHLISVFCALSLTVAALPAQAIQCVPYAREASGINLKGDAWQWWGAAIGVYDRGRIPQDGAVMVFTRQGAMRHGHVSVITRVLSNRLVLVDHANWAPARTSGRGEVTKAVPVLDVSPRNDWSQVRVWFRPAADFGTRIYRTDGFVYQPTPRRAGKPAIHQVALSRAASMFPDDRAIARTLEFEKTSAPATIKAPAEMLIKSIPAPVGKAAHGEDAAIQSPLRTALRSDELNALDKLEMADGSEATIRAAQKMFNRPTSSDAMMFN